MQVVERHPTSTDEITVILGALSALKRGDATVRLPAEWHGVLGRVADVFNDVVERNQRMTSSGFRRSSASRASSANAEASVTSLASGQRRSTRSTS